MGDAARAREDAQRILEGDRYRARDVPRPLEGVLRWLGDRIRDLGEPLYDVLSTPQGAAVAVLVIVGTTVLAATSIARRRNRTHEARARRGAEVGRPDPAALERAASEAEEQGDLAAAVRLRFRAGVVRLEDAGVVPVRADTTTGRVVAAVSSASLEGLARTFDEVAYGDRAARREDVAAARRDWPQVVQEAAAARRAVAVMP